MYAAFSSSESAITLSIERGGLERLRHSHLRDKMTDSASECYAAWTVLRSFEVLAPTMKKLLRYSKAISKPSDFGP